MTLKLLPLLELSECKFHQRMRDRPVHDPQFNLPVKDRVRPLSTTSIHATVSENSCPRRTTLPVSRTRMSNFPAVQRSYVRKRGFAPAAGFILRTTPLRRTAALSSAIASRRDPSRPPSQVQPVPTAPARSASLNVNGSRGMVRPFAEACGAAAATGTLHPTARSSSIPHGRTSPARPSFVTPVRIWLRSVLTAACRPMGRPAHSGADPTPWLADSSMMLRTPLASPPGPGV